MATNTDNTERKERTEQTLHDQFYGLQPALHAVERAVSDGRDLAYMVLDRVPDTPENETLRHYAEHWLETHGRDYWRERGPHAR